MKTVENLIIGAGPAGLAVAGRMRHRKIPFEIIEQAAAVGSTWRNHYDRLHLHTVKQLSALPHLPFPEDYPLYVPRTKVVEYLTNYALHFDIQPHFNTAVTKIRKEGANWIVQTNTEQTFQAKNVILATGVNRVPNMPTWKGQEKFKGTIIHSRDYKNPKPFIGKKTLVVGFGNTGAEVAFDLSESEVDTTTVIRTPVSIVPRDLNGRPVQLTARKLAKLPFGLGDWLGTKIRRVFMGDLSKYGIPLSNVSPTKQLMQTGKTPVIDIGTVEAIKQGKIKIIRTVDAFYEDGIISKGEKMPFDAILLATGYRPELASFIQNIETSLDKYNCPKAAIGTGDFNNLYFVGFDNYKTGGILGTIGDDSTTVVNSIEKQGILTA